MAHRPDKTPFLLRSFVVGPMGVNCYLVADPATKEACLIDPGAEPDRLREAIRKEGLALKFIINTHGHGDHIAANSVFGVPVYIHADDAAFLTDPSKNLSRHFFFTVTSPPASRLLRDGDTVPLGSLAFRVIHTPGHTPGSIALDLAGALFTGDTLFCGGVGRTDFPYGDEDALYRAITTRLFAFPDATPIYPGHGAPSTIGAERQRL